MGGLETGTEERTMHSHLLDKARLAGYLLGDESYSTVDFKLLPWTLSNKHVGISQV